MFGLAQLLPFDNTEKALVARKKVKRLGRLGAILAGGGGFVIVFFPIILNFMLSWQMQIKEGNLFTMGWMDVPMKPTINLYFWNLENPNEFRRGAKPKVRQMGPYAYYIHIKKEIVSWGPDEESVKYLMSVAFYFDHENTVGQLSDNLTLLNPVVYPAAAVVKHILEKIPLSFAVAPIVHGAMTAWFYIHGEELFKEITVGELLEGKVMSMIETISVFLKPLKWFGIKLSTPFGDPVELFERILPGNKFGILLAANHTPIGPGEVYTGQSDHSLFDRFISWRGKTIMNCWDDYECNLINGTEGLTFGKTFISKSDKLYIFAAGELQRTLYASYRELSFRGHLYPRFAPAWRYGLHPPLFSSPDKYPPNKCFCPFSDYQKCDGLYHIGYCYFGAPVAISLPHLLYTSNETQNSVVGIDPDPNKYDTYLDVYPALGMPIDAKFGIQVNFLIHPVPMMMGLGGLPEAVLPFLWIEGAPILPWYLQLGATIGIWLLILIDWGPYFVSFVGFGVIAYTFHFIYKQKEVLFKPMSPSTPLQSFNETERQTEIKDNHLYPDLFTISGNEEVMRSNPPVYVESEKQVTRPYKPDSARRSHINGIGPDRRILSPPGSAE